MSASRVAACFACAAFAVACAAAMNDPTRPPAAFTEAPAGALPTPPVLQSVIIGKATRAAIIDGERVEIGGRFRDAKVVSITEDEVVLSDGTATQTLKMYPDVEKKTARARDAGTAKTPPRSRVP